ncbi:hypothetical protein D9M72_573530 [compost metagenome]
MTLGRQANLDLVQLICDLLGELKALAFVVVICQHQNPTEAAEHVFAIRLPRLNARDSYGGDAALSGRDGTKFTFTNRQPVSGVQ